MTASTLKRDDAVLVVVDVQERLAATMTRRADVVRRTALLARTARIVGLPVVVTRQYPRGLGDTEPALIAVFEEIRDAGASVTDVDKVSFDCFAEPGFSAAIESLGRSQLLLVGMETHICIAQTALTARGRGMDVHVVADACCSRDEEHRTLALARLAHAGCVVTTAESAAYELVGVAGTPEFKELLGAVKACDSDDEAVLD